MKPVTLLAIPTSDSDNSSNPPPVKFLVDTEELSIVFEDSDRTVTFDIQVVRDLSILLLIRS